VAIKLLEHQGGKKRSKVVMTLEHFLASLKKKANQSTHQFMCELHLQLGSTATSFSKKKKKHCYPFLFELLEALLEKMGVESRSRLS